MEGSAHDLCCSIVSILVMGQPQTGELDYLKYCLMSNQNDVGDWGHEYVGTISFDLYFAHPIEFVFEYVFLFQAVGRGDR